MCGISGALHPDPRVRRDALRLSLKAIEHRGPDESATFEDGEAGLGMTRLAIIDLAGGHQPMSTPDGQVTVIFNGEIYNYREIAQELKAQGRVLRTRSDTEVLLHLYELYGVDLVTNLRGMFAFAIYDSPRRRLVMARDRLGKKPLYYALPQPGTMVFASELKAVVPLAQAAGMPLAPCDQSIYDYLSFGVIPQPSTIYQGVHSLPPATVATFEEGNLTTQGYWRPEFEPKLDLTYDAAKEMARTRIREAVELRLRSDVPLGVLLSGGLDSSVVAYEAVKAGATSIQTFTVATGGDLDESPIAQRTAQHLGVPHTVLPLEVDPVAGVHKVVAAYDQPYADSSAIPTMQISELARAHVTVVLNGDGGDEVFGGYRRYAAAAALARVDGLAGTPVRMAARLLESLPSERRSRLGFATRFARGLSMDPAERYLAWTTDMLRQDDKVAFWQGRPVQPSERLVGGRLGPRASALDQLVADDVGVNLLSDLLVKMDIGTMSASLEARSPFLDHTVAEFGWHLPDSYRVKGRQTKRILRDAYCDLLPREVTHGPKRGFEVPMATWLEGPLRPLLHDTLGSPNAAINEYVSPELVRSLLERRAFAERNVAYVLYAMLVLELWLDRCRTQAL
ncbi:MAG: asparagine synthase (glutamine-hydrolyzing) [Mycobacteriaceae bacterium]